MLEFNSTWDPQTRTGKLAALVDLVTPSPVDNAEKFMSKLMKWEAKTVEANKLHRVVLQPEIKTAILISMAPGKMKRDFQEVIVSGRGLDV